MKRSISRGHSGCLATVMCPRPSNRRSRLPGISRAVSANSSRAVEAILGPAEDQRRARIGLRQPARSKSSSASIVVAMSARSSPPAIRRGPASQASAPAATARGAAARARPHHGQRLSLPRRPGPGGHPALQVAALRPEPARGAEQHESADDLWMVGGQLLGDAAAGRDAGHVDRPRAERADRVGVLAASSAIVIPRGSPFCG